MRLIRVLCRIFLSLVTPEPETGEAKVITSEVTFCRFRPRFVSSDQKTVSKYKFFFWTVLFKNLTSSSDIFALLLLPLWHRASRSVRQKRSHTLSPPKPNEKEIESQYFFLPPPSPIGGQSTRSQKKKEKKRLFRRPLHSFSLLFCRVDFPLVRKNLGIGKNTIMKSKINNSGTVRKIRFFILSSLRAKQSAQRRIVQK